VAKNQVKLLIISEKNWRGGMKISDNVDMNSRR